MLIIFVYATILFVYSILLKCHILINSSHQNSSKSCFGLVLLGSPLRRMRLYNEGSRAENHFEPPPPQAGKGREQGSRAPREKATEGVAMQQSLLDKQIHTPQLSLEEMSELSTRKGSEQIMLKGRECSFQIAGENHRSQEGLKRSSPELLSVPD